MDSTPPIRLEPEQLEQLAGLIARRIVEMQAESAIPSKPELTTVEAMRLTGRRSRPAFYRFCKARHVKAIAPGYYRRVAIMRALGAA